MEYSYSLRDRVEQGARMLDLKKPDWATEVARYGDLTAESMSENSCNVEMGRCGCVLARNYGSFWRGQDELGIEGDVFGFNVDRGKLETYEREEVIREYTELAELWNEQVKLRAVV